ncbi:hypothetical protein B484DRAFT_456666 [Ochromonadaceae sp. CCMP2298]|nr:hypothetical protein B484DRAFT_456666 [Ochromonadaceae sp. CCMP2298]|mmetsp:Transcript_31185/g.68797  ORF Transcript_31185/g.68797 Transcript_31185/m.68797 type:complete len:461 (-) Transcript_31185:54-1436(-)
MADPAKIVQLVLELAEADDWVAILNIAAPSQAAQITTASPVPQMRKLYLKLSLVIHPDRLGKKFPDATRAFQTLVQAFERLSSPEIIEEVEASKKKGAPKPAAISRSNEGCFRTRVCCPRCKQPWNEGSLDGNPDYCYNFLMTGLKQYTCSTCLCEFGCMTAIHKCPQCKKDVEYEPGLYHQKTTCGRSCKPFGFMMYHVSDRVMKETKQSVKEELLRRSKAKEAKLRRANRSASRTGDSGEAAFSLGLSDVCPRCGEDFTEFGNEEDQRMHLMECSDTKKQGDFKAKKDKEGQKKQEKEQRAAKQEAAQNLAAVQTLGGGNTMLWLLDADQLRSQAGGLQLDTTGDKDDLISRIVQHSGSAGSSSSGAIQDAPESKKRKNNELVVAKQAKRGSSASTALVIDGRDNDEDLPSSIPSDYQGRSAAQLKSMCACHGLLSGLPKNAKKSDYISALESAMFDS